MTRNKVTKHTQLFIIAVKTNAAPVNIVLHSKVTYIIHLLPEVVGIYFDIIVEVGGHEVLELWC